MTPDQLKASILQLAIQGKLVPQRPEEGTAEELYKEIQREKKKLLAQGKIKKQKPLPPISEDEIPFDIPETWKWVRLGDVCGRFSTGPFGSMLHKSDYCELGIPVVNPTNIVDGKISACKVQRVSAETAARLSTFSLELDDIVLARRGNLSKSASVGCEEAGWLCGTGAFIIHPLEISPDWFCYFYTAPYVQSYLMADSVGTTMNNLNQTLLGKLPLPLPPFAEQKRIVAKIEQTLPLIERYGEAYTALETLDMRFPEDMRKSILQYAIQGKLVPQRPEECTAEDLYKQIQQEKKRLIAAGKLKKQKPLPPITEEEIPFDIPETWKWVRLGDCTTYGQTLNKVKPNEVSADTWNLDLEDIEKGTGRVLQRVKASARRGSGDRVVFKKGDVLFSKLRPYLQKILVADEDGICTTELVPFSGYAGILPEYLILVLKSPAIDSQINGASYGVKMPRAGTEYMRMMLMPLPPVDEQMRIKEALEKVQLRHLSDRM